MFVVTVIFEVKPASADDFRAAVLQQAENSLTREAACSRFDVCFDPERPGRVFLYEIYDDRAAFDEHLASDHFADFDRRVASWVLDKTINTWIQG